MPSPPMTETNLPPNASQRAEDIANAGGRVGIPISDDHVQLAAQWGDSLYQSANVVRAIDYQAHEPSNVFNPVGSNDVPRERNDR